MANKADNNKKDFTSDETSVATPKVTSTKETKIEVATSRVKITQSIKFFSNNSYLDYKKDQVVKVSTKVKGILIDRGVAIAL